MYNGCTWKGVFELTALAQAKTSCTGKNRTIDLERADGRRTKDHAAFSPGNDASSVTTANLRPALWSLAPVSIKSTRKDKTSKREDLTRTAGKKKRKKSQIEGSCRVFPGKRYIILVKLNPRLVLMNTAPVATRTKR